MLAAARSTECRLKCCWLFARRIIESIGRVWLGLRFFPIKINKSKNTSCSCRSTRLASGSLLQLASIVSPRLPACLPARLGIGFFSSAQLRRAAADQTAAPFRFVRGRNAHSTLAASERRSTCANATAAFRFDYSFWRLRCFCWSGAVSARSMMIGSEFGSRPLSASLTSRSDHPSAVFALPV